MQNYFLILIAMSFVNNFGHQKRRPLIRHKKMENVRKDRMTTSSSHENCNCFISNTPGSSSRHFENTLKVLDKKRSLNRKTISLSSIREEPYSLLDLEFNIENRLRELRERNSISLNRLNEVTNEDDDEIIYFMSRDRYGSTNLKMKFVNSLSNLSTIIRNGINIINDNVLSGKRVSEMTTCYEDIEAVTRLLQEKEKDLELTVHIGKELLSQNTQLEKKILELEAELRCANENIAQLNYELVQKTELINVLTDNEESLSELTSPTSTNSINYEVLQKKINLLENENKKLYSDVMQVVQETDEMEEHERKLLQDLNDQLNSSQLQYDNITFELEKYKEENRLQNDQINILTNRLSEAEIRLHELLNENEEAYLTLNITKENQNLLAIELSEFKSRYQETLTLLQETQKMLREKQRKSQPHSNRSSLYLSGMTKPHNNPESLHTELMEISLFSEISSLDSGINSEHGHQKQVPQFQKVFDTVKCASNTAVHQNEICDSLASELNILSSQPRMSSSIYSTTDFSIKPKNNDIPSLSIYSSIYGSNKSDEAISGTESDDDYNSHRQLGQFGCPGAADLESALKNLNSAEIVSRRAKLSYGSYSYENSETAHTPESTFSNVSSSTASSLSHYRYPKKLEIIKPLEGSLTLNQWKGLATPTLSGLLHDNERVKVRGERGLDEFGLLTYSLGDVEEDAAEEFPSMKNFESISQCIYTYTDSKVLHPDDSASITFSLPPSQMSSRMHSECPSRQPTAPPTPRLGLSRRNSCSTFSTSSGLAAMLNERGIQAITPSCLNTPSGPNFSPTITPCNSPECSSPPSANHPPDSISLTSFLTSSAGLIKKKITGNHSNQDNEKAAVLLEKKAMLRSIKLLERVETLGINNILPATVSSSLSSKSQIINKPLATLQSSNIYTRYNSPMTQLTSLKHLSDQKNKVISSCSSQESLSENIVCSTKNTNIDNKDIREVRMKHKMQRQKTRRNMNAVQRPDLGTVNGNKAIDKNKDACKQQGIVKGFVGNISSIFFGRKGGFL